MFDDDKRPGSSNPQPSLFDDEHHDSVWSFPAPRAIRPRSGSAVIKTLLTVDNAKIPEEYYDYYQGLLEIYSVGNGKVGVEAIDRVFNEAGVAADAKDAIWKLVGDRRDSWTREEVWAVIAMVGLVIEGDDLGLDAVDDRRRGEDSFFLLHSSQPSILFIIQYFLPYHLFLIHDVVNLPSSPPRPSRSSLQRSPKAETNFRPSRRRPTL